MLRCTSCRRCEQACPALDRHGAIKEALEHVPALEDSEDIAVYAGKASDPDIYKCGQSGGMVTATLRVLFRQRKITHALVVDMPPGIHPRPRAIILDETARLPQKSIYAPVDLLSLLAELPADVNGIALVGLPCHFEGLTSLLTAESNLSGKIKYRLGLLCDGVLGRSAIDFFSYPPPSTDFSLTYKNKFYPDYRNAAVTVSDGDKIIRTVPAAARMKLKKLLTPPRCLICANKMNLFADVVFGDPWGIDGIDMEHGESLILIRNAMGQEIVDMIRQEQCATLRSVSASEAWQGQQMDTRIRRWNSSCEAYRRAGFGEIPAWSRINKRLDLPAEAPEIRAISEQISMFMQLEKMRQTEVVPRLLRLMYRGEWTEKILRRVKKIYRKLKGTSC